MYICEVFVTNSSLNVNQLYSYAYDEYIESFRRVEVFFSNGRTTALVISCKECEDIAKEEEKRGFKLSRIIRVIDEEPVISAEQYELALWLSRTTVSPFISCLNTMLPKVLRTSRNIKAAKEIECIKVNKTAGPLTKRQQEVYDSLHDGMKAAEARKISVSIIKRFIEQGIVEVYKEEASYKGSDLAINDNFKKLTADQEKVYKDLIDTDKLVSLLFGVTGSGKTEVYLHLARHYLDMGKEVLILVPEISLTPQMISRVKERFNDVIFYHSELSDQERYEQYKRVREGEVRIMVGTRSSVFLPFNDLGLIIIDEEHDTSYKQDSTPCYHVRNVAVKRALAFKAKVLLASATPSLDSYTRALKGDYGFLKLTQRINNMLPDIEIVDLIKSIKKRQSYIITDRLKEELEKTLAGHKQ
ncbi:MAG: primosomal protein N', partial [Erysipelotrichaceae bacterium]|nr:primosomal protein N' [Erysipelotrichaceae bacterium]